MMTFTFVNLWQTGTVRHFAFEGDRAHGAGFNVTVDVDMEMIRKYGIGIQDLPLVCRRFLESAPDAAAIPSLIPFPEDCMRTIQSHAAALTAAKETSRWRSQPLRKRA